MLKRGVHFRKRRRRHAAGMGGAPGDVPGTPVADPEPFATRVRVLSYDAEGCDVRDDVRPADVASSPGRRKVTWVDVQGFEDLVGIQALAQRLGVHPLAFEDAMQPSQRPKVDRFGKDVFFVVRMLRLVNGRVEGEQLSLYLRNGLLVTFQEHPSLDCLDPVRGRIVEARGRIRQAGADYLLYALVDACVDYYFPMLEDVGEQLEQLEEAALTEAPVDFVERVRETKVDLLALRRSIWPLREALIQVTETEVDAFDAETLVYFGDCRDHVVQALDVVETYRETASGLVDVQLSRASHELAEVTKVLTIIATVFMPLTFIAGLYGMNFDPGASPWNMPELRARYGYPITLLVMALVAAGMVYFFVRRGWIGRRRPRRHLR